MSQELKKLVRLAERHGFTTHTSSKGHVIFRDPKGRRVATASKTASDHRSLKNTESHLRAAGLDIPRK